MAACPICGSTQVFRKANVVFDIKFGGGAVMVSSGRDTLLRCTLDVCGGCGRTTTYVQEPQEWVRRVGYDEEFDTSEPASG